MHAIKGIRDGMSPTASYDIIDDDGKKVGRIDLIHTAKKVLWDRFDLDNNCTGEGELTDEERTLSETAQALSAWAKG